MQTRFDLLAGVAALMLSLSTHAAISDKFVCRMEMTDYKTKNKVERNDEFFMPRLPLSSSPAPDVRITSANTLAKVALDTPDAELNATLNFYYKHASKLNNQGDVVDARQWTCMAVSGNYCDKKNSSGPIYTCTDSVTACFENAGDPFDNIMGWTPTAVVNGYPAFYNTNLSSFSKISNNGSEVAEVLVNCYFVGTYE